MVLTLINCKNWFDSVEFETILEALDQSQIDYRYTSLKRNIHKKATSSKRLHKNTKIFRLDRGIRRRDNVSSKLFTASLESLFKETKWRVMVHSLKILNKKIKKQA